MGEIRDKYVYAYLTEKEMEMFDKLAETTNMSYDEIVGKALRAYYNLGELINMYERANKED